MNENHPPPGRLTSLSGEVDIALTASARDRLRRAKAPSTMLAYHGDLRRFLTWATGHTIDADDVAAQFTALLQRHPHSMHLLAANHIDHLAALGRAPSTIDRALAAITVAHRAGTGTRLATEAARGILRAYRKEAAAAGRTVRKATPTTVDALRLMIQALEPDTPAGIRDRALLVVGFALGARRQDLANLNLADLTFTTDGLQVRIRQSKTDRDAVGHTVALPYGRHLMTCPVRSTMTLIGVLVHHRHASGPLYRRIDRHGIIGRAPHGRGDTHGRITGQTVSHIVRRTAERAGLDAAHAFSGHSLRRGFATETYRAGADLVRIARHGGWKDGSAELAGYIELCDQWRHNPLADVGI